MLTRKLIIVLGKVGHGKSTFVKNLRQTLKKSITIDLNGEYDGTIFYNFIDLVDYIKNKKNFRVVLRPIDQTDIEYIFKLCWEMRNIWLIIEEADMYISSINPSPDFLQLVKFGRHREVNIIAVARRVPDLSIAMRAQYTSIVTFAQTEVRDLQNLKNLGFNINEVQNLEKYKYVTLGETLSQTANNKTEEEQ